MKVFISWSGDRSKALANALRDWLPMALQYVKPWVSDKDIGAGDRWALSIAGELESSDFGIICITPENAQSPWILFEAGALSKSMMQAKVIPLLFDLDQSDLSGPLSQFQAQKFEKSGIMEVIKAINKMAEPGIEDNLANSSVNSLWSNLSDKLETIPSIPSDQQLSRSQDEILEELVTGVRGISLRMREFDPDLLDRGRYARKRRMRFHPMMFKGFADMADEREDSASVLLLMAGFFREDFPWLTELLTESYREIRDGGSKVADRVFHRLIRAVKIMSDGPFMRDMMGNSKDEFIMMKELPMLLDMTLHRIRDRSLFSKTHDEPQNDG